MPLQGSTPDVSTWLAELGLAQYASLFVENHVDAKLLPTLTDNDLRELGVTSFGHRKRMLQAIACLDAPPSEPPLSAPSPTTGPERRQLTVLFVDLVVSTELATHLDPEDMSDILRLYQNIVADEVNRLGGYVAKLMGDGALAYFGWPQAHEDEAERAVRAALAMASRIGGLVTPIGTTMAARGRPRDRHGRCGRHNRHRRRAGGDCRWGSFESRRPSPGAGPARRYCRERRDTAAPRRSLRVDATRRSRAKGLPSKIVRGACSSASAHRGRFDARIGVSCAPMVGREQELALLLQRWTEASAGEGQAFVLLGDAGIGKSAAGQGTAGRRFPGSLIARSICNALRFMAIRRSGQCFRRLADERSSPKPHSRTADHWSRNWCWGGPALDCSSARNELERHHVAPELSPEARRAQLFGVLVRYVSRPCEAGILAAHPRGRALGRSEHARVGPDTGRPSQHVRNSFADYRPSGHLAGPSWHIARDAPDARSFGARRRGRHGNLEGIRPADLAFVYPRDRYQPYRWRPAVRRGIEQGPHDHRSALTDHGSPEIPSSLHDTLMARLHRLPGHHDVAQIASCIGREFGYRMLAAIADLPEAQLRYGLEQLCEAELLFRHGSPPEASYSFKHALVRDAAYESLLKRRRRTIHARILAALENGVAPAAAEEMARHAAAAGLWQKAFQYFSVAGRAALGRAANAEGFALTAKALAAAEQIADDINARVNVIDLHQARGWAYLTIGDTAAVALELDAAETSAAQLGLERVTCRLRAQRAHVETIFGGTIRNAVRYGGDAARIAANSGTRNFRRSLGSFWDSRSCSRDNTGLQSQN